MTDFFGTRFCAVAPQPRGYVVLTAIFSLLSMATSTPGATVSPLLARGYTVIPEPQKVTLRGSDFEFTPFWQLELGTGVKADASPWKV